MANTLANALNTLASATHNDALPGSADFWSEHIHKSLNNGLVVSDMRSSLLEDYAELTDELSIDFAIWYNARFNDQTDPTNITIELLCDYVVPRNCKKYRITGDDWICEIARFKVLADSIYGALLLPYDIPDDFNEAQLNKFTKGQEIALGLLNQQLGTSGGRYSAQIFSMKMARTIICVNKNGLSNEFTADFDAKDNKASNRDARYQQIKCSVRGQKVCNVVRANKLLALDIATGKILHKIARDLDYELHNKICHVKSNCQRDEQLKKAAAARAAARAAATDSTEGGKGNKKRRRGDKSEQAQLFLPDDAIDHVSNPSVEQEGRTFLNNHYEGKADNNEESKNLFTKPMPVRNKGAPRCKLPTPTVPAGTMSLSMGADATTNNNPYHIQSRTSYAQHPVNAGQQAYDTPYPFVNGQGINNLTAPGYPTAGQVAGMSQMPMTQPQYPQYPTYGNHARSATSFGNPQMKMGATQPSMSVYHFGFTTPSTPMFRASPNLDFDAAAPSFNFKYGNKGGIDDDDA
ncbi:hypothetical protein LTR78_009940 [Recurvomyces mirabilis]|uniref:Uncharacterized protein n=1 Tax=Recurvomyces mirabilis TaxID=574656 RepID=A0AAE0TN22_9PEZI|nr:hypothetical protein LTR78_009940 [Recurvomyces mirabilis]KAK5160372.1 hypothetical protein LTS14_001384 [Recurvomyces mirabilis]